MYKKNNNKNFYTIQKLKFLKENNKTDILKKPSWLKIKLPKNFFNINRVRFQLRNNHLNTVCEEAACPNITECFNKKTATFMILGKICTRRCSFCNVQYGRPSLVDKQEPKKIANTIFDMKLKHVVITSVNRDDLHDGGAKHFVKCIHEIRKKIPNITIEILVPDFRNCVNNAIDILNNNLPDIFNHNIESVPRLYKKVRPGANYKKSLTLLKKFKIFNPHIPTKSGIMIGLGEKKHELINVLNDLYINGVSMLTIGQYLQPTKYHVPVKKYFTISEFHQIKKQAISIGFKYVASGPLVRSSYHADLQIKGIEI